MTKLQKFFYVLYFCLLGVLLYIIFKPVFPPISTRQIAPWQKKLTLSCVQKATNIKVDFLSQCTSMLPCDCKLSTNLKQ